MGIYKAANASSTHLFPRRDASPPVVSLAVVEERVPRMVPTAARTLFIRYRWRIRRRTTSLSRFRVFSIGFMHTCLVTAIDTDSNSFSHSPSSSSSFPLLLPSLTALSSFDTRPCRFTAALLELQDMFLLSVYQKCVLKLFQSTG